MSEALAIGAVTAGWSLLILSIWVWRSGGKPLLLLGAAPFALSTTLVQNAVFFPVDSLLGGRNVAVLVAQVLCVSAIGLFYVLVCEALRKNGVDRGTVIRTVMVMLAAAGLLLGIYVTSDWKHSDPSLTPYLTHWNAIVFTSVVWVGMGWFAVVGLVAVFTDLRNHSSKSLKWGMWTVGFGALFALSATATHFVKIWLAFQSLHDAVLSSEAVEIGFINAATIFIAGGLAVPSAAVLLTLIWQDSVDRLFLWRMFRTWSRLPIRGSNLVLESEATRRSDFWTRHPRTTLYRRWVEVQDVVSFGSSTLTTDEEELILSIEKRVSSNDKQLR